MKKVLFFLMVVALVLGGCKVAMPKLNSEGETTTQSIVEDEIVGEEEAQALYTISEPDKDGWRTYTNNALALTMDIPKMPKESLDKLYGAGHWALTFSSDENSIVMIIEKLDHPIVQDVINGQYSITARPYPVRSSSKRKDLMGKEENDVYELYLDATSMQGESYIDGPWFITDLEDTGNALTVYSIKIGVSKGGSTSFSIVTEEEIGIMERIISSIKFTGSEDLHTISKPDKDDWRTYTNNVIGFSMDIPKIPKEETAEFYADHPSFTFDYGDYSVQAWVSKGYGDMVESIVSGNMPGPSTSHTSLYSDNIRKDLAGVESLEVHEMYFNDFGGHVDGPHFILKLRSGDEGDYSWDIWATGGRLDRNSPERDPESTKIIERMISSIKFTGSEDLYTISEPGEDGWVTYTNYAVGLSIDLPSMPKEYAEELARQGNEHLKIIMPLSDSEDFFVNFETYDVRPESSA
ncbi:MAG: hypothetical protein PHU71_06305, partial [Candidatus Gracilibacteria bacterium]|nr:hypothetical protein [Candidatus Gracilibacteria bacterium]